MFRISCLDCHLDRNYHYGQSIYTVTAPPIQKQTFPIAKRIAPSQQCGNLRLNTYLIADIHLDRVRSRS
jgi:hypothetical protein